MLFERTAEYQCYKSGKANECLESGHWLKERSRIAGLGCRGSEWQCYSASSVQQMNEGSPDSGAITSICEMSERGNEGE